MKHVSLEYIQERISSTGDWGPDNLLGWAGPHSADLVDAPPDAPPVVICPGFGNCTTDYSAPFGVVENGLEAVLKVGFR